MVYSLPFCGDSVQFDQAVLFGDQAGVQVYHAVLVDVQVQLEHQPKKKLLIIIVTKKYNYNIEDIFIAVQYLRDHQAFNFLSIKGALMP